jgi:AraC-like DNA-binding protein
MELNDRKIPLGPGVCVWMRPGGLYYARHDPEDPIEVTYIHFTPHTADGRPYLRGRRLPPEVHSVGDTLFFGAALEKIIRLLRPPVKITRQREAAEHLFAALILELLGGGGEEPDNGWKPHRIEIERQAARIYAQPGATPAIRDLAREISLSPDHYAKVFRDVAGISPRELIQRARVDRASQLLRESDMTVGEIAGQLGYSDVFQFSRLFKKRTGRCPSAWRGMTG